MKNIAALYLSGDIMQKSIRKFVLELLSSGI
jgi:hypothetical protein